MYLPRTTECVEPADESIPENTTTGTTDACARIRSPTWQKISIEEWKRIFVNTLQRSLPIPFQVPAEVPTHIPFGPYEVLAGPYAYTYTYHVPCAHADVPAIKFLDKSANGT